MRSSGTLERHKAVEKCIQQQIASIKPCSTTGRAWVVAAAIERPTVGWSCIYDSSAGSDGGETTDGFNLMP
jgi:hypothetical protein